MQLLIFFIDLFVGTYRLSSHARLEAFVIQTKLKLTVVTSKPGIGNRVVSLVSQAGDGLLHSDV